jgi:hypothetical protein
MGRQAIKLPGLWAAAALALLVLAASAGPAQAQERWAALSLLGDRMTVVYARMQTGTRTNPNLVHPLPMQDNVLDRLALRSVADARVDGMPEIVLLGLRDPKIYEAQERLFESDGQALLDALRKAVAGVQVTHILLLAKARGEASFPIRDGHIGIGTVEGLGFYVDRSTRVERAETGTADLGYIAPFAYYRLVLFDLARNRIVAEENVRASTTYPVASSGETDPWNVISAEQKVEDLERLLNQHTGAALSRLVAARARS